MRRRRAEVTALLLKSQAFGWMCQARKGSPGTDCPNPLVPKRGRPLTGSWKVTPMPLGGPADDSVFAPGLTT